MEFTLGMYHKLKTAYNKAVENQEKQFVFEDVILLTDYAKYLIEYLEMNQRKLV